MERIKVTLSENFVFSTSIPIRITDLNYGGHVGNDVFLVLIHEARQQFLNHFGYSELNFGGIGIIMADAAIEFKTELDYGDIVTISVAATGFDRLGFDIRYLLQVEKDGKTIIAGKAKTGMLCYDYALKKKVGVPQEVIERLASR